MKAGDLVKYQWSSLYAEIDEDIHGMGIGMVLEEPRIWRDMGAPDRNFGVSVTVLWSDGVVRTHEEEEIAHVSRADYEAQ